MNSMWQDNRLRVALALVFGLGFIIYKYPPHTPCTSQLDEYQGAVVQMAGAFKSKLDACVKHPDAGGCIAFFEIINRYEGKFNEVSPQCQQEMAGSSVLTRWISLGMEMYVRLAWGSMPPASSSLRNGWLEANQVAQFCRLRRHLETVNGKDSWAEFVKDITPTLPGEPELQARIGFNEVWTRTLMSDPCSYSY